MNQNTQHVPVLAKQVIDHLNPQIGDSYLDLTAGYGGHAELVLEKTKNPKSSVLVDRDRRAVAHLSERFGDLGVEIINQDFYSASVNLVDKNRNFDLILADLGVSSPHLNEPSSGFALQHEGPLDMRMDTSQELSADKIVNTYSEKELQDIIATNSEEPKARVIAHLIVSNRPLTTTTQLANIVAKAWPGHSRVHPATRTFQAIRIAVNNELTQLQSSLPLWIDLLKPEGRIVVISFHSLEDRLVKQAFAAQSGKRYDARLQLLTKKPVIGDHQELVFNPRARSAKLRAAVKINNNRKGTTNAYSGQK